MKIVRCVTEALFVPRLPFKCRNHSYPRPNTMMNNLVCGAQRLELWAEDRLICQLFSFFFSSSGLNWFIFRSNYQVHCLNEEPAVKHSGGSDLLGVTEHETIVEEPRTLRPRSTTDNRLMEVKIQSAKLQKQVTGFSPISFIFELILVNGMAKHPSVQVVY